MQNATQGNCNTKRNENSPNASQETECLPEANVSIIEDMTTEDKLENMKAIVNGTMRRKLYFNPAYFEPHLLMVRTIGAKNDKIFYINNAFSLSVAAAGRS